MEFRVDTVAAPSLDNDKAPRGCVFLNDLSKFSNWYTWFDYLDGHVQGLPGRFNESNRVRISFGLVADVVSLVNIGMVSAMVQRNIEVKNVAIKKDSLIRDSVAYNLIRRCTQ